MALITYLYGLQLFAEGGGDGGASAGGGESGTTAGTGATETAYPSNIPERAKKYYDAALKKTQRVDTVPSKEAEESTITTEEETATATEQIEETPKKMSYKELIKSEEYKADHERHIQKVVKDRMKSHDEILGLVAQKYGIDLNSESYKDDLKAALKADDSVYERYAEEHDVSVDEARRMVGIEQQLQKANQEAAERKAQDEYDRTINALRSAASQTKTEYPDFDLDTAMADDRFRRLVVAFGGDTTQAYEAINHRLLQKKAVADAEARATAAVQNSVKANRNRPLEGGFSSTNITDATPDFKNMSLSQLRRYAETHRKR